MAWLVATSHSKIIGKVWSRITSLTTAGKYPTVLHEVLGLTYLSKRLAQFLHKNLKTYRRNQNHLFRHLSPTRGFLAQELVAPRKLPSPLTQLTMQKSLPVK